VSLSSTPRRAFFEAAASRTPSGLDRLFLDRDDDEAVRLLDDSPASPATRLVARSDDPLIVVIVVDGVRLSPGDFDHVRAIRSATFTTPRA
jgi:hypothetical protein